MADVACYAIMISSDEAYEDSLRLINGKSSGIKKLSKMKGFVGVHTDPLGKFMTVIYRTIEDRGKAYTEAKKFFKTVVTAFGSVYVDDSYVKE